MATTDEVKKLELKFLAYLLSDKIYIGLATAKMKREYLVNIKKLYILITAFYERYKGVISKDKVELQCNKVKMESDEKIKIMSTIESAMSETIVDEADFNFIMDELINHYKRRVTVQIAEKIVNGNPNTCTEENFEKILADIKNGLTKIQSTDFDIKREGLIDADADERLEKYLRLKEHPEEANLIKTGFKHIDDAIVGWGYGNSIFVTGRKGDGKSTLLLNFAYYLWKQGKNILFFSLEIDKEQYERRWDARAALVASRGLKSGSLTEEEESVYKEYITNLKQGKDLFNNPVGKVCIVDCPSRITPMYVESKTEEMERKTHTIYDCVIVDYAGIMSANNPTGILRDDMGSISLDLKNFARSKNKIMFSAVQMNREGKRDADQKNGRTDTTSIAGSDQIADHCDYVMTIRSIDDTSGVIESTKTRDGAGFRFSIEKKYDKLQVAEIDDEGWEQI